VIVIGLASHSGANPSNPRNIVLHALRKCNPQLRVHSLRRFKEGWDNYVYELNHTLVVKLSKDIYSGEKLLKEACLLPYLRVELGHIIPLELAKCVVNIDNEEHVILVYEAIQGGSMVNRAPSQMPSAHSLCYALAHLLQRVHTMSVPMECARMVPVHDTPQKWSKTILSEVYRLTGMAGSTLKPDLRQAVLQRVRDYVRQLQHSGFKPKLIHGDIDPRNVLIDQKGRLVGLIDWGEAVVGDPALDYAGLFYIDEHLGNHALEIQCEEEVSRLLPRVRFHRELAPLYWVAYGMNDANNRLVRKGLSLLRTKFIQ